MINVHTRYLDALESEGWLNRALEFLPTVASSPSVRSPARGLTTPEFSVLLAYTKNADLVEMLASDLPDDPYLRTGVDRLFPAAMRERFRSEILAHRCAARSSPLDW